MMGSQMDERPAVDYRYLIETLDENLVLPVRRRYLGVGEHRVGSAADADWLLPVAGVSRVHATIEVLADGGVIICDLGSTNGTRVDGRRVRRVAVAASAQLRFGPVEARLLPVTAGSDLLAHRRSDATAHGSTGAAAAPSTWVDSRWVALLDALVAVLAQPPAERPAALVKTCAIQLGGSWRLEHENAVVAASGGAEEAAQRLVAAGWILAGDVPPDPIVRAALSMALFGIDGASAAPMATPVTEAIARVDSRSPPLRACYRMAAKVAPSDLPVLVLGETGVGKEVLARWIHANSRRATGPFLAINCAALPADLLEAELFGIEKGAATGVTARPGLIEQAAGGTLFLDELAELAPAIQAKLLRALESTHLYRVGGRQAVPIDVRFLAATHRHLREQIEAGNFRLDLFHRLAAVEIELPPLRGRIEDLPELATRLYAEALGERGVPSPGITAAALAALAAYPWPGNIRELRNEIRRAVWLIDAGEPLDACHLSPRLRPTAHTPPPVLTLAAALENAERRAIEQALAITQGDIERASALLDIGRSSLYRKLKDHSLPREESP